MFGSKELRFVVLEVVRGEAVGRVDSRHRTREAAEKAAERSRRMLAERCKNAFVSFRVVEYAPGVKVSGRGLHALSPFVGACRTEDLPSIGGVFAYYDDNKGVTTFLSRDVVSNYFVIPDEEGAFMVVGGDV